MGQNVFQMNIYIFNYNYNVLHLTNNEANQYILNTTLALFTKVKLQ